MRTRPGHRAILVLCSTLFMVVGCADPPTREIDQAQGAIDTARAAGAPDYAAEEFGAAEAALTRARQAVTDRDYRLALNFALDARDRAQTSARQAADEKARVRTEADRALRAGEAGVDHLKERVVVAEQARIQATPLESMQKALASAEASVASARAAFARGDYRQTLDTLSALQTHLTRTTSEINAAMSARPPRRPVKRNR